MDALCALEAVEAEVEDGKADPVGVVAAVAAAAIADEVEVEDGKADPDESELLQLVAVGQVQKRKYEQRSWQLCQNAQEKRLKGLKEKKWCW